MTDNESRRKEEFADDKRNSISMMSFELYFSVQMVVTLSGSSSSIIWYRIYATRKFWDRIESEDRDLRGRRLFLEKNFKLDPQQIFNI